jgi:hypothetical protein
MAVDTTLISGAGRAAQAEVSGLLTKAKGVSKITGEVVSSGIEVAEAIQEKQAKEELEKQEEAKQYDEAVSALMDNQGHLSDEAFKVTYDRLMGEARENFINGDKSTRAIELRKLEKQAQSYEGFVDQREAYAISADGDMISEEMFDLEGNEEAKALRDALIAQNANLELDTSDNQYKLKVGDKFYNNSQIESMLRPFKKPVEAIESIAKLQAGYADSGADGRTSFNENQVMTNVRNTIIKNNDSKTLAYNPILGGGNGNSFHQDLIEALQKATYQEFGIQAIDDPTPEDNTITEDDAKKLAKELINSNKLDDYLAHYITNSFKKQFKDSRESEIIEPTINTDWDSTTETGN